MKLNKRIITVMSIVCSLFLVVIVYLTIFTLFQAKDIVNSSYNQRIWEKEEKVLRGTIYDRNGTVLAKSEETDDGQKRVYPFGNLYAHSIGYNSRTYGKTNLELNFNSYLLQTQSVIDALKKKEADNTNFSQGADLSLTLDHEMTNLAASLLGNSSGSVIALNPATGETYCLYSYPTFNPNENALIKEWDKLTESDNSPFLSRVTQSVYAPGSTFKIITSAAAIENGYRDYEINDEGMVNIGGKKLHNAGKKAYGNIGMKPAFSYSSNVYFASLAQTLGKTRMQRTMENFLINKKIPYDISTKGVDFDFDELDDVSLAATGIGQGKLQVTPLHMALSACAVANDGVIMKPYIVQKASYQNGKTTYKFSPKALSTAMGRDTAQTITEYMVECVKSGTGRSARVSGVTVAGKTGTAENEKKGKTHAWFVGFAPAENPQIAICVMKEYSGSGGGSVCAPIASKLIKYALNSGLIN